MSKLKVYGGDIAARGKSQVATIIAAKSKKEAAEILGISTGEMTKYWSVTGNTYAQEIARAYPRTILCASKLHGDDYLPLRKGVSLASSFVCFQDPDEALSPNAMLLMTLSELMAIATEHKLTLKGRDLSQHFWADFFGVSLSQFKKMISATAYDRREVIESVQSHVRTIQFLLRNQDDDILKDMIQSFIFEKEASVQ